MVFFGKSVNIKFVSEFSAASIKNWKGLTLGHLETLVLIDVEGQDLEAEVEYTKDNAELLVSNSTDFDTWLNEVVFDLDNFRSKSKGNSPKKTGKDVPQ